MTFILKDPTTGKVLTGYAGDGMYYSLSDKHFPVLAILLDEETYDDFLKYEPVVYDENDGEEIIIKDLVKVEVVRTDK